MKNWFKGKTKEKGIKKSLVSWFEEDNENRASIMILSDCKEGITIGGLYGNGEQIVAGLVNEMLGTEDIAQIVLAASKHYLDMCEKEESTIGKTTKVVS